MRVGKDFRAYVFNGIVGRMIFEEIFSLAKRVFRFSSQSTDLLYSQKL